jgi:hypothetical protein
MAFSGLARVATLMKCRAQAGAAWRRPNPSFKRTPDAAAQRLGGNISDTSNDPLYLVFISALVTVPYAAEKQRGAPLTEHEVNDIRGMSICVAVPLSVALDQEKKKRLCRHRCGKLQGRMAICACAIVAKAPNHAFESLISFAGTAFRLIVRQRERILNIWNNGSVRSAVAIWSGGLFPKLVRAFN